LCLSHRHFQILAGRENRMELAKMAADGAMTCDAMVVEVMKKEGKYDSKTAVKSLQCSLDEHNELLRWFAIVKERGTEIITENSYNLETKIMKNVNKLKEGGV